MSLIPFGCFRSGPTRTNARNLGPWRSPSRARFRTMRPNPHQPEAPARDSPALALRAGVTSPRGKFKPPGWRSGPLEPALTFQGGEVRPEEQGLPRQLLPGPPLGVVQDGVGLFDGPLVQRLVETQGLVRVPGGRSLEGRCLLVGPPGEGSQPLPLSSRQVQPAQQLGVPVRKLRPAIPG